MVIDTQINDVEWVRCDSDEEVVDISIERAESCGDRNLISEVEAESLSEFNGFSVVKFVNIKVSGSNRLQIIREGFAEQVHWSCFSSSSKKKYIKLIKSSKETYVAESKKVYGGKALDADETIDGGDFICLYRGRSMSWRECKARIEAGANDDYFLNVTKGVIIDGCGIGHRGAMDNHSCEPNAGLEHAYTPGRERAPYGVLIAKQTILRGQPIEVSYGYFDARRDPLPNLNDLTLYTPCLCGASNCVKVLRVNEKRSCTDRSPCQ